MARPQMTVTKRQREQKKRERQQEKLQRRALRKAEGPSPLVIEGEPEGEQA